jgi:hypothetical protein
MLSHETAYDDIEENKTGKLMDINLIEEGRGADMVPLDESRQIYGDESTSERKQVCRNLGRVLEMDWSNKRRKLASQQILI